MALYRKFIVAVLGAITTAVTLGLLSEDYNKYVAVAAVFLSSLGVYAIPNEPSIE